MTFQSFEDIEAWQDARQLTKSIRAICIRQNVKKDNVWVEQISKANLSITSNIAEGNDSQSNSEFAKFLGYSKRSSAEVKSQLYYAYDQGYISEAELESLLKQSHLVSSKLAKLIRYLKSTNISSRQCYKNNSVTQ